MDTIERINHIGSTAVEGLIAKPIVDILLEVDYNTDINNLKLRLENSGWTKQARKEFSKRYLP